MATKNAKKVERKKGYHTWLYGERFWHRTESGAKRRAMQALNWCNNPQVIEVATGNLIFGRPE